MNEIGARAVRCDGQFAGQFRRVHRSEWETVRRDGNPTLFPTEAEAKCAAWETLAASGHLTSLMRRDGETIGDSYRAAIEARYFTRKTADGESRTEATNRNRPAAERATVPIGD